jgi:hypothetical protein
MKRWLPSLFLAILMFGCVSGDDEGINQLGEALKSLANCDLESAVNNARAARASGLADSEAVASSLVIEAFALDLAGDSRANEIYMDYVEAVPSLSSVEEAKTDTHEIWAPIATKCSKLVK